MVLQATRKGLALALRHKKLAGVLWLCGLAIAAAAQTAFWRNNYTLMKHAAAVTEQNYVALCTLGLVLLEERQRPGEAVTILREAVAANPDYPNSHTGLGLAWSALGRYPEALASFTRALQLAPHDPDALGSAVLEAAAEPSTRAAMGAAGRARAEREFSIPAAVAAYERIYCDLAAGTVEDRR